MSNDTPSWSGDEAGVPPPSPPPPPPPPPPAAPTGDRAWGAGTPDGTAGRTSSLLRRLGARIIDGLIVGIPLGLILILGLGLDASGTVYAVLTAALNLGYFVFLESSQGATLGKRILGMSVASTAGGHLTAEQSFRRNWWLLLGLIPYLGPFASLGITIYIAVTISSDPGDQGFHDKMADAVVLDR